jgi:hypothetical protein
MIARARAMKNLAKGLAGSLLVGILSIGAGGCGTTERNVVVTLQNVPAETSLAHFSIDLNPTNHAELTLKKTFDGFIFKLPDKSMPLPEELKGLLIVQGTAHDCATCILGDSQSGLSVDDQTIFPTEIFLFFIPRATRTCPPNPPACAP